MGGGNGGGPCVLYFTLAVDHRLAGRPPARVACAPSNSLPPPPASGLDRLCRLHCCLFLPSSLPSSESFSFWPRSVNRAQCWFGLFGPFFARGALRVVAPLLASLLLALTHFYSYTLSLTGVGWKKRIALCSSQAAGLSLSLCPASPSRRLTHSSRGIVVGKFDLQLLFLTFSPPPPSSLTPSLSSAARLSEGVFLKANSSKCPAGFLSDILAGRAAHFVRRLGKFSS